MAILDLNKYYYFRMSNGRPYAIKESLIEINTNIMHNFQAMTTEQREFYLANPTATVMEVWNCEITPPYVPPTPDVSEYAAQKVKDLEAACYASVSVSDLEYAMANACLAGTALVYTGNKYYTTNQAISVMKRFMDESSHAMSVRDTYKPRIEAASTIEAIDTLYNTAIEQL
jgi:hypothetical protein